ncbi:hypothetical protein TSAR_001136 [Trichomalopsis sarcophagae]|uniref:Tyr recombinase domain-containing protein n=1 Tax=Trichomalopsis sarcophagae TaxID=543379 RepID=A0A232EF48_9HYME|nr:hypothetical protein TSAR_001136 [Trichomalopsis sarcophagae]
MSEIARRRRPNQLQVREARTSRPVDQRPNKRTSASASEPATPPAQTISPKTSPPIFNSRDSIIKAFEMKNVPRASIEILLASLSKATYKQWWQFCVLSKEDFYKPTRNRLLRFLTYSSQNNASYATLNTYRSAISLLSLEKIGEDLMISRLFKGIEKIKPPRPKYNFTWDVSIVLNYLRSLERSIELKLRTLRSLSFPDLTYKAVMLIILCTAHRAQTLANIKLSNIKSTEKSLEIRIPDTIKTTGRTRYQQLLYLPKYPHDESLCVATVIEYYINVTKDLRSSEKLFISTVKPYKEIGSQTISRWIKQVLCKIGIDVSLFSGHSTRHAATSHAFEIQQYSKYQVFTKFYNRLILPENNSFALAILES